MSQSRIFVQIFSPKKNTVSHFFYTSNLKTETNKVRKNIAIELSKYVNTSVYETLSCTSPTCVILLPQTEFTERPRLYLPA